MGYIINQHVLNNINYYRERMNNQTNALFSAISAANNFNFFGTPNYYLYSLIAENIRMDLNSLLSLNIDYDIFGFLGLQRNLRNSIEAYYDLFNLTLDEYYFLLMKYFSKNAPECNIWELEYLNKSKYEKYVEDKTKVKKSYLKIIDKAKIAYENGLDQNAYNRLKEFSITANDFIHPDIFFPIMDIQSKAIKLKNMLDMDCEILTNSYRLLVEFCERKVGLQLHTLYDAARMELKNLYDANNTQCYIVQSAY